MKISINVSFLILSLFALSAAASPVKLDDAVTTELSNSSIDLESLRMNPVGSLQDIVEQDILFCRQPQDDGEVTRLADLVQQSFQEGNRVLGNLKTFEYRITALATHLQSIVEDRRRLSERVATSLKEALHKWRGAVTQLREVKGTNVRPILVEISTCRNIVENEITPPSSLIPEISAVLQRLEDNLRPRNLRHETTDDLNQLKDYVNKWKKTKDIIHPKLLIFVDWVEGWEDSDIKKDILIALEKISDVWQKNI